MSIKHRITSKTIKHLIETHQIQPVTNQTQNHVKKERLFQLRKIKLVLILILSSLLSKLHLKKNWMRNLKQSTL